MPGPDVLVVDDNVGFLRVVRAVLAPVFTIHTAETGGDAIAFLAREAPFEHAPPPAFVVLDFHLPDMDAPDVLARLPRRTGRTDVPVLVLSQADWPEDEARALAAGGWRFRAKPSQLDELEETITRFWRETLGAHS
jgi:CheY-like chemotaxis protein